MIAFKNIPIFIYSIVTTVCIIILYHTIDFNKEDLINIVIKQIIYSIFITGLLYWIYWLTYG